MRKISGNKKTLIITLALFLSGESLAGSNKDNDAIQKAKFNGVGEVLLLGEKDSIWIKVKDYNSSDFKELTSPLDKKNHRKKYGILRVGLYGIDLSGSDGIMGKGTTDTYRDFFEQVMIQLSTAGPMDFSCLLFDGKSIPLCEISANDVNINYALVRDGVADFAEIKGDDYSLINKPYIEAREEARKGRVGIWRPFYNVFK